MKVILLEDVPKLGKAGKVVEVKRGFGTNLLLPQGKAEIVTKSRLKELETHQKQIQQKSVYIKQRAEQVRDKIMERPLVVHMKAGEGGKLYGSVTGIAVAKAVKEQFGIDIDKSDVSITESIKIIGTYTINVKLHPEVIADIKIDVESESAE
ncbi:50S ribosomal protein L9 [bacterium]|nr:50S ribosomal protein L9 [bacterium]